MVHLDGLMSSRQTEIVHYFPRNGLSVELKRKKITHKKQMELVKDFFLVRFDTFSSK